MTALPRSTSTFRRHLDTAQPLSFALSTLVSNRTSSVVKPLITTVVLSGVVTRLNVMVRNATVSLNAARITALSWTKSATVTLVGNLKRLVSLSKVVTASSNANRQVFISYNKQALVVLGTGRMITFLRILSAIVTLTGFGIVARIKILLASVAASNNYFIIAHTGGGGGGGPQSHNYVRVALVQSSATRVTGQSLSQLLLAVVTTSASRIWVVGRNLLAFLNTSGRRQTSVLLIRSTNLIMTPNVNKSVGWLFSATVNLSPRISRLFNVTYLAIVNVVSTTLRNLRAVMAWWLIGTVTPEWTLGGQTVPSSISSLSLEKLHIQVKATNIVNLTSDVVTMAIVPLGSSPAGKFKPATWETQGSNFLASILVGPTSVIGVLSPGQYDVWVQVTDNPEVPVKKADVSLTVY